MSKDTSPPRPTAYVVDDDPSVLESISWLLGSMDIPFMVYASAPDFLCDYVPARPGCLILDVRMPGMSGLELQEYLKEGEIEIPIIFISGHSDLPVAVHAMKQGAIEFLQKPFDQRLLSEAIERAFALDRQRRELAAAENDLDARLKSLSPRELETLRLLLAGESAKEIGRRLAISPRTVEYHRNNILAKMNAHSLVALAVLIGSRLD